MKPALSATVFAAGLALLLTGCTGSSPTANSPSGEPAAASSPSPKHLTGCDLVSQAEASKALGASLGAGTANPFTLTAKIVAHSGCSFASSVGGPAVGYDLNTLSDSIPAEQYANAIWAGIKANSPDFKSISIDGFNGVSYSKTIVIKEQNNRQVFQDEVSFFNGQTMVAVVAANGTPGGALAIAHLIATRM